nr:cohesin domain-containing protein [bacterium]
MNRTNVLLSLLVLGLLLLGASCGGGSSIVQLDDTRDAQGISEGGFNLVRYDDTGSTTNALNPTLGLTVQPGGATTTVIIAIDDQQPMLGVTLDLHYDQSRFSPQDVAFGELIDTPVELAVMSVGGLVALGQVSTEGAGTRNGQFATVTFRN